METGEQTNGAPPAKAEERKPTERVILRQQRALVVPDGVTDEQLEAAAKALAPKKGKGVLVSVVWEEVARVTAATKIAAIEAYAGTPGTADAKLGTFRAPSVTAWKDAAVYDAPPLPLVERSVVE